MKTTSLITAAMIVGGSMSADDRPPEIIGLEQAAMDFVAAYNARDAEALSLLFTEEAEMTDLRGEDLTTGREAIKARYEILFEEDDVPALALEVDSVRLVAPNLAIEDGTAHFTPLDGENEPPRSSTYTAVLLKTAEGTWKIASTRSLEDTTSAAGQLAALARLINGEWTVKTANGMRLFLAIGWDRSGKFLTADMLTTAADAPPQEGSFRISWNAASKSIVSWFFDADGGVAQGNWTPTDDGWLVRSDGTTADGETVSYTLEITSEGDHALVWDITNRVIAGERTPDARLRLVPPAPEPASNP